MGWRSQEYELRAANPADASDAAKMASLESLANGTRDGKFPTQRQTAEEMVRIDGLLQDPRTWSDLTFRHGELIAFNFGYPYEDTDIHHLDTLAVHPAHWGEREGWKHLKMSISHAALSGAVVIDLWANKDNERARRLYDRNDFIVVEGTQRRHTASHKVQVKYERKL